MFFFTNINSKKFEYITFSIINNINIMDNKLGFIL